MKNEWNLIRELSSEKQFAWRESIFQMPKIRLYREGIEFDLIQEADRDAVAEYIQKNRHWTDRSIAGKLSQREMSRITRENPLDQQFVEIALRVNGEELKLKQGTGRVWIPQELEFWFAQSEEIKPFIKEFSLDPDRCWGHLRQRYQWVQCVPEEIHTLEVTLSCRPEPFYGDGFETPETGSPVAVKNPRTMAEYTLTVEEREEKTLNLKHSDGLQHPDKVTAIVFHMEPQISQEKFQLFDFGTDDLPRDENGNPVKPKGATSVIFARPKGEHTAVSRLHFSHPEKILWTPVFAEKTVEDLTVTLIG